jgi:citrate lyase gamma subunit
MNSQDPLDQLIEVQKQQAEAFLLQHSINQQLGRQLERLVMSINALYKIQRAQMDLLRMLAEQSDDPAVARMLLAFQQTAADELTTLAHVLGASDGEDQ